MVNERILEAYVRAINNHPESLEILRKCIESIAISAVMDSEGIKERGEFVMKTFYEIDQMLPKHPYFPSNIVERQICFLEIIIKYGLDMMKNKQGVI